MATQSAIAGSFAGRVGVIGGRAGIPRMARNALLTNYKNEMFDVLDFFGALFTSNLYRHEWFAPPGYGTVTGYEDDIDRILIGVVFH